MNMRRQAMLQAGFLLVAMLANAASHNTPMRIKVLDSETHSVSLGGNDVPKNCDQVNFDAYCNNSKTAVVTNTMLVQEGNAPPFRVTCTIESKWSRCIPLPKGESFDARREKHGITVYFEDENGKARKQLYTWVDKDGKTEQRATMAAIATEPAPRAAEPPQNSPDASVVPPTGQVPGVLTEKVRCNFSSTPSGAEVAIDGKYMGNTPSEIPLSTGTHVIVLSMPRFTQWKRELTVSPGSELTVSAVLQKEQQ